MRIVHVIDSLNDMAAGPTKSVVALANQQYADGHEVSVITTSGEPKSAFNFKLINSSPYSKILILYLRVWIQFFKDQKISNIIQKWTIIHLHGIWRPSVNFPLMLVWPPSVRIISSPRGMLMRPAMENKALKKRMFWLIYQRWILRMVDAFHTTGESEKESCLYLFPNIFSFIVKNGIEAPDLRITKVHEKNPLSPIKFGFLGRIHPIKNIDILIKSWCTISSHSNDAKLIICG